MTHWLKDDPRYPKFVFGNLAGVGKRKVNKKNGLFFYAADFHDNRNTSLWEAFPTKSYFQPQEIKQIKLSGAPYHWPVEIDSLKTPTFKYFKSRVQACIDSPADKVVLAKLNSYIFAEKLDPYAILESLNQDNRIFAYMPEPGVAYIGSTPEHLFIRKGSKLFTEAVAGTRPEGLEEELLTSKKDINEFLIVKKEIAKKILPLTKPFALTNELYLKKSHHLYHLHYPFNVELKEEIDDLTLIQHLHPTPAVCGLPNKMATQIIQNLEPFDRGLYSGPIGLISNHATEIAVGIRSALIIENVLHLFGGAGIVNSSVPTDEWNEIEAKLQGFYGRERNCKEEPTLQRSHH